MAQDSLQSYCFDIQKAEIFQTGIVSIDSSGRTSNDNVLDIGRIKIGSPSLQKSLQKFGDFQSTSPYERHKIHSTENGFH